ncbi:hypothetical protein CBS101457_006088 [Exobasidium rhododendri]|nr:hypothetical protein CBS101457_006088 [Exobasidium rhododendri]
MSTSRAPGYIRNDELAAKLKERKQGDKTIAIVDVRDDDFEGGNIPGCVHIPSAVFGDKINELVQSSLKDVHQVIFHCALSQARGPKAARIYKEAREEAIKSGKLKTSPGSQDQVVAILRDGFGGFGPKYKNDATLVENWDEESWKYR